MRHAELGRVKKAETSKQKLLSALGMERTEELLRQCDMKSGAEAMFWTLGPKTMKLSIVFPEIRKSSRILGIKI